MEIHDIAIFLFWKSATSARRMSKNDCSRNKLQSSPTTQHLIATIPQPYRDNGFVKPFYFHSIMNDTTSIGLVVEDILDGHS